MRKLRIDFTQDNPCLDGCFAGKVGEHNATMLVITPPAEMTANGDITLYIVAFSSGGEVIHSTLFAKSETVELSLWSQLTQNRNLLLQLEGYDDNANLVIKSPVVALKLLPSVNGKEVDADINCPDLKAQVVKNTAELDKFSEDADGNLLYCGKAIGAGSGLTDEQAATLHLHSNKTVLDNITKDAVANRVAYYGNVLGYKSEIPSSMTSGDMTNAWNGTYPASMRYVGADALMTQIDYIKKLISTVPKFNIAVVDVLPSEDISATTVYLLKDTETKGNLYTEYIYVNDAWECLGSQEVDLTGYAKIEDIPNNKDLLEKFREELGNVYGVTYYGMPLALRMEIPTSTNQLDNNSGFITEKEIEDIRAELGNINGSITLNPVFSYGTYDDLNYKARAKTDCFVIEPNKTVKITNTNTTVYNYAFYRYDENHSLTAAIAWISDTETSFVIPANTVNCGIIAKKVAGGAFTDAELIELSNCFTVEYSDKSYNDKINENTENIKAIKVDVEDLKAVDYGAKMIYPTGFTSRLLPNVYCKCFGEFATDIDIESLKIAGDVVVWISADGDDTNAGTEDAPKKTLAGAFAVTDCTTVMIKSGTYLIDEHYTASQIIGKRNLIGIGSVIFDSSNNAGFIQAKSSAYIENIEFVGGNSCFKASLADTDTFCAYKCKFHDSLTSNGLTVVGGNIYVIECEAYNTKLDGFNYHTNTANNSIPCVVEWNCYAHDCGDGENTSSNGSTIHDGASIVRIGGEYCNCHGGVVADQGVDETTSSYSVNFGVYSHGSTIETEGYEHFNASFWAQKFSKMWLYMCRSSGSTYDISSLQNSAVNSMSMISADMWGNSDYIDESSTVKRI